MHWFFDKLNMTGSKAQLYNGIALIATFFSCRLVYGIYMSTWVYRDMWNAVWEGPSLEWINNAAALNAPSVRAFAVGDGPIPLWLFLIYVASNIVLNSLNVYWFFKMISAVRKRFVPVDEKKTEAPVAASTEKASTSAIDGSGEVRHRAKLADALIVEDDLTEVQ